MSPTSLMVSEADVCCTGNKTVESAYLDQDPQSCTVKCARPDLRLPCSLTEYLTESNIEAPQLISYCFFHLSPARTSIIQPFPPLIRKALCCAQSSCPSRPTCWVTRWHPRLIPFSTMVSCSNFIQLKCLVQETDPQAHSIQLHFILSRE